MGTSARAASAREELAGMAVGLVGLVGWWDTTSFQGGQAHFVGPTVLTQLGEVHPEVLHSFFPFFLKTIVSLVTR